jgi:hypothetical protein
MGIYLWVQYDFKEIDREREKWLKKKKSRVERESESELMAMRK